MVKFICVTGGVVSGIGKGITSSSIGVLLKATGLRVTSIKIDPYLNTDAGTMSPYEHGEVFVLDDGGEVDLDLGNYERFLDITLCRDHNITTGKVYSRVIAKEREGEYLGKTVQVIPHVTDEIQTWIDEISKKPVDGSDKAPDVCIIELGGTVGDIESMVFLEAMRQLRYRVGSDNFCHVHVSLVPVVGAVGEPKSKPAQHSVKELRAAGLSPDIIVCRSSQPLPLSSVSKISQFCMVSSTNIICVHDVSNIYKVPLLMLEQRVPAMVLNCLRITKIPVQTLPKWQEMADIVDQATQEVRIGIVGKYTGLADSYLSVTKALQHAAIECGVRLRIDWIESDKLEKKTEDEKARIILSQVHGILIPGGFGDRGIQGKLEAIQHAREQKIPFFGICLGMQLAVIEIARNILNHKDANSTEFDEATTHPVVINMPEISTTHLGGTMRLGIRETQVQDEKSIAYKLYDRKIISERHRHRYEVNPDYIDQLEEAGLIFTGKGDKNKRMEIAELSTETHPFFFGVQFHPEFLSRPGRPSPCFKGFMQAAAQQQEKEDSGEKLKTNGHEMETEKTDLETEPKEESTKNVLKKKKSQPKSPTKPKSPTRKTTDLSKKRPKRKSVSTKKQNGSQEQRKKKA